jgi:hypothetical protein
MTSEPFIADAYTRSEEVASEALRILKEALANLRASFEILPEPSEPLPFGLIRDQMEVSGVSDRLEEIREVLSDLRAEVETLIETGWPFVARVGGREGPLR